MTRDEALREGLAAGRERAFAALYDRYAPRLYRVALRLLGRREDAEDVVQELFVALVRGRARLADVDDLDAYLFASLRRTAARWGQRRDRQPIASDEIAQGAVSPANRETSDEQQRLQQAIQTLPRAQREVIALKLDGELTFAEIAAVLDINANTAASRYRYALEKLRAALNAPANEK